MKNKDIFNLYEALEEISQDKDLKFTIQTTYNLAYNLHILEPFYKAILDTRTTVLNKYGKDSECGKFIPKEQLTDFQKEWNSFMEIDVDVVLKQIKLNTLGDTISMNLLTRLFPIIE